MMLTAADWCIPAAVLLAYGVLPVAKREKGFNNATPRDPAFYKTGLRARVYGAHVNGLEALPFFIGAILMAETHGANPAYLNLLALGFIAARCAYIGAYLADKPSLRSAVWAVGLLLNFAIFCLPLAG